MATIFFPPADDDGLSCDTYSFGWTSGCIDPNTGLNRGFTQEWYYEEKVGAWIAIGPDATGGADLDNVGPTYDHVAHNSPIYESGLGGTLRKFAFLTEDGGLSFDYIFFPDLVDPNEASFELTQRNWYAPTNNVFDSQTEVPYGIDGVTLCSDGTYKYFYCASSSTESFRVSFNTSPAAGTAYSPLSIGPSGDIYISWNDSSEGTQLFKSPDNTSVAGDQMPAGFSADNGRNSIELNKVFVGFTLDGPSSTAAILNLTYWDINGGDYTTEPFSGIVKTENYWYAFASTTGDINDITASDIINGAKGASGTYGILQPTGNDENSPLNITLPASDFGNAGNTTFLYLAFPTRMNVNPDTELYYAPNIPSSSGFGSSSTLAREIDITNDLNYEETYDLYKSSQRGVDPDGLRITT